MSISHISRRFLPSSAAMRALEALDRLGSATAVADELNQTQSAVSRQLQVLEEQLGVTLVLRRGRRLVLTPEAGEYAARLREALQIITQASMKLAVNPSGGSLHLAILPTFGMRWLVPRLSEFARAYPEVTINLSTRIRPFDFAAEPFDAAIRFGPRDWLGIGAMRLRSERVVAVCTKTMYDAYDVRGPADLLKMPLLHIETRPEAWREWFSKNGIDATPPAGTVYDQFSTITQVALHGMGVALLPNYLVEQDLATGKLIRACGGPVQMDGAYYLVWPDHKAQNPALRKFRDWLSTHSEDEDPLPR